MSSIMVSVDRAYATSYRRSVVTMALFRPVSEILHFEEYDDLEIRVGGQSRSLKRVPFDRSPMICYYCSVLTLSLKRTVFEILALKKLP